MLCAKLATTFTFKWNKSVSQKWHLFFLGLCLIDSSSLIFILLYYGFLIPILVPTVILILVPVLVPVLVPTLILILVPVLVPVSVPIMIQGFSSRPMSRVLVLVLTPILIFDFHIGPSISLSIGPNHDPRFLSKVVVPDL